MKKRIIPTAEPFFLPAGKTGCVLVHGFTGAPKEMRLMGEHLHSNGISVLAVRLAGHATDVHDLPRTRWRDWLASVEDGIHLLSGYCDSVFIAGLSMGGILALLAASIYPLQGAIAMSTPFTLNDDWRIRAANLLFPFIPFVNKGKSDTVDKKSALEHVEYASYPTRSIVELTRLLDTLHQNIKNISIPVLMINSKSDQSVPYSQQDQYRQRIPGEFLETIMLEKSGHVIIEDVERETVFNASLEFMTEHTR